MLKQIVYPCFCGLERDFVCSDITNILLSINQLNIARLCSNEVKNMIFENRKLLSNTLHPPSEEAFSSDNRPFTWKMFLSHSQDIKIQKIVLKDFLALQKNVNCSPSFKAYAQGFTIKIATPEGKKFFYPFDCKQSPQQFLLSKGINCKK